MFKISSLSQSYLSEVRVAVPGETGKKKEIVFDARYKRLSQDELDTLDEQLRKGEKTDREVLNEVMIGWDRVADEDGNALEFNAENFSVLLNIYPVRPTLIKNFFGSIQVAALKN